MNTHKEHWKRIVLWLLLLGSIALNYILWNTNEFLETKLIYTKYDIIEYCVN